MHASPTCKQDDGDALGVEWSSTALGHAPERFDAAFAPQRAATPPAPRWPRPRPCCGGLACPRAARGAVARLSWPCGRRSGRAFRPPRSQRKGASAHFETNLCDAYWGVPLSWQARLQQQYSRDFAAITWSLFAASRRRCMIGTSGLRQRSRLASARGPLLERDLRADA
jgi:hypothetical protein